MCFFCHYFLNTYLVFLYLMEIIHKNDKIPLIKYEEVI